MFLFSLKMNKLRTVLFFLTVSGICKSLMLQQQEATAFVVLKISPFCDHRTKVGKQALKTVRRKALCETLAGRVQLKWQSQQGRKGTWKWLGERQKSQRRAEGVRGDKMQCLCAHLWRSQQIHFISQSSFSPEAHRRQPCSHGVHSVTHSGILKPQRADDWGSHRAVQGSMCGIEQEGSCAATTSTSKPCIGILLKLQMFKCSHARMAGFISGVLKLCSFWINR